MNENLENRIGEIIEQEKEKTKKKRPFLEMIDFSYENGPKGQFLSRLRAKTREKTFILFKEHRNPEASIRKVFQNLRRLLNKNKIKKIQKMNFYFKEAS